MSFNKFLRKIATGTSDSCAFDEAINPAKRVDIMPGIHSITVQHQGKTMMIKRSQDPNATINPRFAKVSRPCPPFCIQPIKLAKGVETIGELELFHYLIQTGEKNNEIQIIDSRLAEWSMKGTIPGSINIPWTLLSRNHDASIKSIVQILQSKFGVTLLAGKNCGDVSSAIENKQPQQVFDFSGAKTLILYCNGMWCGQTPESIQALLTLGYPPKKLKYYRDGMQGWEILGLTTYKYEASFCTQPTETDNWFNNPLLKRVKNKLTG